MAPEAEDRSRQAQTLAQIWKRISRQHLSGGAGCSCGMGGLLIQVSDFELDIVEFVLDAAREAGRSDLVGFIEAVSARGPDRYSLVALLDAIARADHPAMPPASDLQFALDRLQTTLSSMQASHSGNGFVCD